MALVADFVDWLAHDNQPSGPCAGRRGTKRRPGQPRGGATAATRQAKAAIDPGVVVLEPAVRRARILQARRIIGTQVFDPSGKRAGRIEDLSIDKRSGRVTFALIGIEGGLGFLRRLYAAPWALLRYDASRGGYVTPAERADVERGPALTPEELRSLGADDDAWRQKLAIYYGAYLTIPFV